MISARRRSRSVTAWMSLKKIGAAGQRHVQAARAERALNLRDDPAKLVGQGAQRDHGVGRVAVRRGLTGIVAVGGDRAPRCRGCADRPATASTASKIGRVGRAEGRTGEDHQQRRRVLAERALDLAGRLRRLELWRREAAWRQRADALGTSGNAAPSSATQRRRRASDGRGPSGRGDRTGRAAALRRHT